MYSLVLHYLRPFRKISTLVATNELCFTLYENMNGILFHSGERKMRLEMKQKQYRKNLGEFKRDH